MIDFNFRIFLQNNILYFTIEFCLYIRNNVCVNVPPAGCITGVENLLMDLFLWISYVTCIQQKNFVISNAQDFFYILFPYSANSKEAE